MKVHLQMLDWDSQFFDRRIARISTNQLDMSMYELIRLVSLDSDFGIDCLYYLVDSNDLESIQCAEKVGFKLVDIRMTLECKIPAQSHVLKNDDIIIRESIPADLDVLTAISGTAYQASRFYADPCFSKEKSSELYQIWLKNSIETDYADAVIVAELKNEPVGYITCHLNKPAGEGNIGLVGIAQAAQGQGIGSIILSHALRWFAQHNMKVVNVVTQGRNITAQRLYQRNGFVTRSVELWYHQWLTNCAEK